MNSPHSMSSQHVLHEETSLVMSPPIIDFAPAQLPAIFRVESVARYPTERHQIITRANLFHDRASLTVEWRSTHVDVRIVRGALVGVRWLNNRAHSKGAIPISRLVLLERAEAEVNLCHLVPPRWVQDRELVSRAAALLENLPRGFRHLFNAVFWDGGRFERYLTGPSSVNGHHNGMKGNFRHSVEVAEQSLGQGCGQEVIFPPLLSLGGLLHDAGKADEYRYDRNKQRFVLSERGELIGHKHTLLEWLATARARHRVILPEQHYLTLLHVLTAVKGAPDWLGMRIPRRLEAGILARADGLSGEADLFNRNMPSIRGSGSYHVHLGVRPYPITVPAIDQCITQQP